MMKIAIKKIAGRLSYYDSKNNNNNQIKTKEQ